MCWVIPPCSPSTTLVLRIESRSVVFPWSTCPITVTTGGRGTSSDSESSNTGRSATAGGGGGASMSTMNPNDSATPSINSGGIVWPAPTAWPRVMSWATTSLAGTPSASANSVTEAPDGTDTMSSSTSGSGAGSAAASSAASDSASGSASTTSGSSPATARRRSSADSSSSPDEAVFTSIPSSWACASNSFESIPRSLASS